MPFAHHTTILNRCACIECVTTSFQVTSKVGSLPAEDTALNDRLYYNQVKTCFRLLENAVATVGCRLDNFGIYL